MTNGLIFTEYSRETLEILKNLNKPVSIKDISNELGITYSAAKSRLHKLVKLGKIKRAKPGIYYIGDMVRPLEKPKGKYAVLNGLLYSDRKKYPSPMIVLYNSEVAKYCKGQSIVVLRKGENFVVRKYSPLLGKKMHYVRSSSITFSVKSEILTNQEKQQIFSENESKRIHIIFYPDEWGITRKNIFGTESKEDGELYEMLSKYESVYKSGRLDPVKADLIIKRNNLKIPIEITTAKQINDRGKIKSYEILSRLCFALKWVQNNSTPFFIVIHKNWKKSKWIRSEEKFARKNDIYLIYTDFDKNWAKEVTRKILSTINLFF